MMEVSCYVRIMNGLFIDEEMSFFRKEVRYAAVSTIHFVISKPGRLQTRLILKARAQIRRRNSIENCAS